MSELVQRHGRCHRRVQRIGPAVPDRDPPPQLRAAQDLIRQPLPLRTHTDDQRRIGRQIAKLRVRRGIEGDEGIPVFRHAMLLRGASGASAESLEDLVDIAITECERFFPAFQFVLWGGKSPAEALQAAMLDCVGEA